MRRRDAQPTDTVRRLVAELMKQNRTMLPVLLGAIVSAILGIIYPMLIAGAIEEVISETTHFRNGRPLLHVILGALLVIFLIRAVFGFIQEYTMSCVSQNLALQMRKNVSEKLNHLPLQYYDTHKKGDILSRVTGDLEKIADTMQNSLSQLLSSGVAMVGAIGMMFYLHRGLALAVLATVFAGMILAAVISDKTKRYQTAQQNALGAFNAGIEEIFTGNTLVKAYGQEENMTAIAEGLSDTLYRTGRNAQFVTFLINPLIQLLNHLGYVAVAFGGAMLVVGGGISIAYIPAFFNYTNKSSESVLNVAYLINSLQGAVAAAGRVYALLDETEQIPDAEDSLAFSNPKGAVTFDHVRFGYSADNILMEDITLEVKPGSKIAIVGPTGAGKTTLVNLLMRFYELNGGSISIDGADISRISRRTLYHTVGIVLQDTWLFDGTIADNIAYGRENATREDVIRAAKMARIDHFIRTMPQGYDTVPDDETTGISAGQKQLLTIARAILADPQILILDEATSSVDTRTELEIQKAMDTLMEGRTSFIIAHRLSTIRDADRILVMKHGTIVESGRHEELMAQNGAYYELYNAQFLTICDSEV
ncbi:MAG: ABC transporter ATP-binding protein/permease [Clostridium sp.]|nr:ABC transporter ATP-binding protein/permease [Acetatifactor muris]MCM1527922.1 ABC transporter ATP-binding protein/permease [Bacteroides sp.]MCM1564013.1 ABC transporter ATP-binding protein/permease [Clostridium sp.]